MHTDTKSRNIALAVAVFIVLGGLIQFANLRTNPPGFFIDESSIAYNAHLISTSGHDEHGESWPLFFRAFGEFKNPVYIYLLAGVFKLTGPSMLAARSLSALLGLVTVLLLAILALRLTKDLTFTLLFATLCLLTPWLFELSRLAMEVAIYPLTVALFLLAVWRAATKTKWTFVEITSLAATLALLTYTYSIGRLLAPMLALGLLFFATRARLLAIVLTWILYAASWIPILIFNHRQPAAFMGRFRAITYLIPESSWRRIGWAFGKHFVNNINPWRLFVTESSEVSEIVHIPGKPAMLTITAALIVVSLFALFRLRLVNRWWLFIFYGLFVSVIPASLTIDDFHMLRLSPMPVFLLVLTIPALKWLLDSGERTKRTLFVATLLAVGIQGLLFQRSYHASATSPRRLHTFDADYPSKILPTALATAGSEPVYLGDADARPGYIQAFWYATLQGIPLNRFVNLGLSNSPPKGAVVITTELRCNDCRKLAESEPYTTYISTAPPKETKPLPASGMSAEVSVLDPPAQLEPGQRLTIHVSVKNISEVAWPAGDRGSSLYRVSVGNHWLDVNSVVIINDDGRASLLEDLNPGQIVTVPLTINAPRRSGEYLLEVDLLQEGISWFGTKGSRTWRGRVLVVE